MMMSSQQRFAALKLLHAEIALLTRNEEILARQKTALVACDRKQFRLLQAQQESVLRDMERQRAVRIAAMPRSETDLIAAVSDWPESEKETAHELIDMIISLAVKVKALSEDNKPLIANELKFVEFELDLIMKAARTSSHYAKTGMSAASFGNRLLNQVA